MRVSPAMQARFWSLLDFVLKLVLTALFVGLAVWSYAKMTHTPVERVLFIQRAKAAEALNQSKGSPTVAKVTSDLRAFDAPPPHRRRHRRWIVIPIIFGLGAVAYFLFR